MVAGDIHHQEIAIVVIAVVGVDVVEYPGALNFVVCILLNTPVLLFFYWKYYVFWIFYCATM